MTIGDMVVVLADPLAWGYGVIRDVVTDGRLLVEFEPDDGPGDTPGPRDLFTAHELEAADVWQRAHGWPCSLTAQDLRWLEGAA